jgi:pilus assembly protein CpaC
MQSRHETQTTAHGPDEIKQVMKFLSKCGVGILLGILAWVPAWADDIEMRVGDVRVLDFPVEVQTATPGNSKILGSAFVNEGRRLILTAEDVGYTELKIWLANGEEQSHKIYVLAKETNLDPTQIVEILKNIPGISVRQVGNNVVVEGSVTEYSSSLIQKVKEKSPSIIDLTSKTSDADVIKVLRMVPNVSVQKVGKMLVVRGNVNSDGKEALEKIMAAYPDILNLTNEKLLVDDPMIFMNVKITEFGNSALKSLGIDWTTSFAGPSGAYAKDFRYIGKDPATSVWNNQTGGTSITGNPQVYARLPDGTPELISSVRDSVGYFGIATMITSAINLAVNNGDALMLASPTLSAKSGGKAEFLAGGQIPITVPQGDGTNTTEFKDYGITLNIEPKAGKDGSITSKVIAEVSNIDKSVTNSLGVPGFLSRKASTEVNMHNGQTLVISGLVNREVTNSVKKVAGLGDIPILGQLFKSTDFNNKKSDLVIFITPYIAGAESKINKKGLQKAAALRSRFLQSIDKGPEILD